MTKKAVIFQPFPKSALFFASVFALGIFALALFTPLAASAKEGTPLPNVKSGKGTVTGLPLPRYVSLKSARVNVRRGPGKDYPIEWVFEKRGLPVEVTAEYDRWLRVRDREGDVGWVWHSMLDGRRSAIILGEKGAKPLPILHEDADDKSAVVAYAEPGVIAELQSCEGDWCRVKIDGYKGWLARATLWGVYAGENFE